MLRKIKDTFGRTGDTVREYPMVLLMALLGAVSLMCFADDNYNSASTYFVFIRFCLVCCLGISLMFALNMLSQRIGRGTLLEISGVLFLVYFYFLLPDQERDFTEKYAFLLIPTFILSHLLVSFAAFLGREKEMNFWQYNKNLFINLFLTAIFTGVFTVGVELAVLAVDKLFEFNLRDSLYFQIFFFLTIFGSCLIFLLFSEDGLRTLEKEAKYPLILKFFTQYILIPLLIIYVTILYLYAAKILINWQLPRGWVSYLILAYSIVGILALLLVYPLKQKTAKSWVKLFSKIFYFSLIPLLILLFTAIFTRILEYGYTEPRYYVLLISLWLTTVVFYFIFYQKPTIKFIPISLFIFGFFSLTLPYFNTFSVAKRSQENQLQKILVHSKLLDGRHIDFTRTVSDSVVENVSSKFAFLMKRDDSIFLMNLLKENDKNALTREIAGQRYINYESNMRNRFSNVVSTKKTKNISDLEIFANQKIQKISGYDYMINFEDYYNDTSVNIGKDLFTISSRRGTPDLQLKITLNNKETWDVTPFIIQSAANYADKTGRIEVPELMTEHDLGDYRLKVFLSSIARQQTNRKQIYFNGGYLLIKAK